LRLEVSNKSRRQNQVIPAPNEGAALEDGPNLVNAGIAGPLMRCGRLRHVCQRVPSFAALQLDAQGQAVTRRRLLLIVAAFMAGGIAMLGLYDPAIDPQAAAALADRLATEYHRQSGNPRAAFAAREGRQWADGWEFRWRYRPCPEFASLRVWISRNGRRTSYAEFPDCAPVTGLPADPRKT
jgi:hypothetical protein